jgi:predicted nucleic acid-binding protein
MKKIYVLDACALIAFLNNESGKDVVKDILLSTLDNDTSVMINVINLLEVYYDIYRRCGEEAAIDFLGTIGETPVIINQKISADVFKMAGRLKAVYKISIADSIALAETAISGGSLLTSDHHEFEVVEKFEKISIRWIR